MGRFWSNSVGNKGRGIKDSLNHRVVHTGIRDSSPGTMGEKETEKWEGPGWGRGATLMQNLSSAHGQAPWVVEGSRPPSNWPQKGEVEFRNYSVRYRPGLELVLKDLSLRVHGGEKVRVGWVCAWEVAILLVGSVGFWDSKCSSSNIGSAFLEKSCRCPQ